GLGFHCSVANHRVAVSQVAIVTRRPAVSPPGAFLPMANIASQKKRILRTDRERLENRRLTSAVKTQFRRLESAVSGGDDAEIAEQHRLLVSRIDKAVQRGALHANNGARKKARAARIRSGANAS